MIQMNFCAEFNEVQNERPGTNKINLSMLHWNPLLCACVYEEPEEALNAFECFKAEQIANYILYDPKYKGKKIQRKE